jgi:hypothetical protein
VGFHCSSFHNCVSSQGLQLRTSKPKWYKQFFDVLMNVHIYEGFFYLHPWEKINEFYKYPKLENSETQLSYLVCLVLKKDPVCRKITIQEERKALSLEMTLKDSE